MHAIYAMPSNFGHKKPIFLIKLLFSCWCNVIKLWAQGTHILTQTSLFTLMHATFAMSSNFGHKEPIFLIKLLFSRWCMLSMQCHQTLGTRNPYSYSNFSFHVDACHLCNVIKLWAQGTHILNQSSLLMHVAFAMPSNIGLIVIGLMIQRYLLSSFCEMLISTSSCISNFQNHCHHYKEQV